MEGGGQSWSNRADDLHNPRNRHALCVLVDVRPPRVASSLARAAEALDAQAPGPFRRNVRHNPALAGWEADAVRRDNTPSTENSCSKVGANLVE
jgi:hypothetical protein